MWLSDRGLAWNLLEKYIKKGLNKWKIKSHSWVERLRIDTVFCLPKFICVFVVLIIKTLELFRCKKVDPKIPMEKQRTG